MQVTITARRMDLTDALREYAEQKVRRITKYLDNIIEAQVILTVEKYRHIAEVTIQANGIKINGEEETDDMYSAIDKVMDKIERQLRKHKGRVGNRKQRTPTKTLGKSEELYNQELFPPETIDADDIIAEQVNDIASRIFPINSFALKPMSPEEAAMQLEIKDDQFILFRNSSSEQINLIYRRKDGNFGLLET